MKIIDSFIFYNEIELLKARLEYLGDIVDLFIICEANVDFSGASKPYILESILQDLPNKEKIYYHQAKVNFYHPSWLYKKLKYIGRPYKFSWKIQDFQRNSIQILINKEGIPFDVILFGDLDEIPDHNTIKELKSSSFENITTLIQKSFYYNIFTYQSGETWAGTIWIPKKYFNQNKLNKWRSDRDQFPLKINGGFHFSYFMSPELIAKKINAIASSEKLNDTYLSLDEHVIVEKITSKKDLFDRDLNFKESNYSLPPNLEKLILKYLPQCCTNLGDPL